MLIVMNDSRTGVYILGVGVYARCIYYYHMDLCGIYGTHTQEACPLYFAESRIFLGTKVLNVHLGTVELVLPA